MLTFAAAALVLIMIPGPDQALITRNALVGGRRAGLSTMVGGMLGLSVHITAAALGVSALLLASATVFTALKAVGVAYLVWMGVSTLRAARAGRALRTPAPGTQAPGAVRASGGEPASGGGHAPGGKPADGPGGGPADAGPEAQGAAGGADEPPDGYGELATLPGRRCVRQGFLSNALNPKVALFFVTFLPQFLPTDGPSPIRALLLSAVFVLLYLLWFTGYTLTVDRLGAILRRPSVRTRIEQATGALLIAFGVRLALIH